MKAAASWMIAMIALALGASGALGAVPRNAPPAKQAGGPAQQVPLPVTIVEATGTDAVVSVALEAKNPRVDVSLTLVSKASKELKLEFQTLPFFRDEKSTQPVDLQIEGESGRDLVLPPGGVRRIHLRALLEPEGSYRSNVRILRKDDPSAQPLNVAVKVDRKIVELPMELKGTAPIEKRRFFPWVTEPTTVLLLVFPHTDLPDLAFPTLVKSERKAKVDESTGVDGGLTLSAGDKDQGAGSTKAPETAKGRVLSPDKWQSIPIVLEGADTPGRYDATMRFDRTGYKGAEATVTVLVRWHWWVALFWIIVGVLVSLGLHQYTRVVRPRLLVEQRLAHLRTRLEEAKNLAKGIADAEGLVAQVETALQERWSQSRMWRRVSGSDYDIFERIVPALVLWIEVKKRRIALQPASAGTNLDTVLSNARTAFASKPPDAIAVESSIKALEAAPETVRTSMKSALLEVTAKMADQLIGDGRPGIVMLSDEVRQVRSLAEHDRLEEAVKAWMGVLHQHLQFFAKDLLERVDKNSPQPMGFDAAQWTEHSASAREAVEKAKAINDVEEAGRKLRSAIRWHQDSVAAAQIRFVGTLAEDDQKRFEPALNQVREAQRADDIAKIWQALRAAVAARSGSKQGSDTTVSQVEAQFDIGFGLTQPAEWEALGQASAAKKTRLQLTLLDVAISIVVIFIAGLVGVQQLWSDNLVWGGGAAMLAAFLAGFASDQLANAGVRAFFTP